MVGPDNFRHDVIDFRVVTFVDVLTKNPVKASDSFIRSSKSRDLVRFLYQVNVHRDEIISFDALGYVCGQS